MVIQKITGFTRVYQAECFPDDVKAMFGKSAGEKVRYMRWLFTWLSVLDSDGKKALDLEQFECLKGTAEPPLYAIRHPHSQINERYIFMFTDDESSILLTAFKEKSAKDYESAIQRAGHIISDLEG